MNDRSGRTGDRTGSGPGSDGEAPAAAAPGEDPAAGEGGTAGDAGPPAPAEGGGRAADRRAEALRANLRRRKAAQRKARAADPTPPASTD